RDKLASTSSTGRWQLPDGNGAPDDGAVAPARADLEASADRLDPISHVDHPCAGTDPLFVEALTGVADLEAKARAVLPEGQNGNRVRAGVLDGVLECFEADVVDRDLHVL